MAVVIVHIATVGIGELELCAGDHLAGYLILFLDHQRPGPLIPEGELLHTPAHDLDVLGGAVQHEALHGLDLAGNHGGAGFDALQHDLPGLIRVIHPIIRADSSASAVHHLEADAGERFILGAFDKLSDDQGGARFVVKDQAVGNAGAHHDIFRRLVQDVAHRGLFLGHHDGGIGGQPCDGHGAVGAGGVKAVAGADHMAGAVPNQELSALQRLLGHGVPLQNGEGAKGIVIESNRLRVPGVHHHRLRGGVLAVVVRGAFLRNHIGAGEQLGQHDLAVL